MGVKTRCLTANEYDLIIKTTKTGFCGYPPNERIASILQIEANTGLRIGDIVEKLRLCDIVKDGTNYRFNIIEQKTNKSRTFIVPKPIYKFLVNYCKKANICDNEIIFPISQRRVQFHLQTLCKFLDLKNISTHSFRKFFATNVYENSNYNIRLVQILLQHSDVSITQKYLDVEQNQANQVLNKVVRLK